jgi:hypothetical protein
LSRLFAVEEGDIDNNVFDLVLNDLPEVQYMTAAIEGSSVTGPDTLAAGVGSCKLDRDHGLG